jgi:hypothetical protein
MTSIFLQRHSFFAMKELDWENDVQQISKNVNSRLKGNYRIIREKIKEIVFKPSAIKITEILQSVHQYE